MDMSIDEAIEILQGRDNCMEYVTDNDSEAFEMAIEIMRKYQKIEQIINNAKDSDGAVKYNWLYEQIKEVIEDGNDD